MYKCKKCGKTFSTPAKKEKNIFTIFYLTVKAQWDKSIGPESIYEKRCPYCNAHEKDLEVYMDAEEYDNVQNNVK